MLSRRQFLESGVILFPPEVLAAAQHAHEMTQQGPRARMDFFDIKSAAEIESLAEAILPEDDTPGAPEAGVIYFIDRALVTFSRDSPADSSKSLPPLPGKRGSALAAEVGGKIYVIGGATTVDGSKDPFFTFFGPSKVLATNDVYDSATNKWQSRTPMSVARNHAFGAAVNGIFWAASGSQTTARFVADLVVTTQAEISSRSPFQPGGAQEHDGV